MEEKIIVQLDSPERKYSRTYHDFLDNSFLTAEEQMAYIALRSYIDFREDAGDVFPSMDSICRRSKLSKPRARRTINSLIKKGIVKKVQRGLTKTNVYSLVDSPGIWRAKDLDEVKVAAEETELERAVRIVQEAGYTVVKKEEPGAAPAKATDPSTPKHSLKANNITSDLKSQDDGQTPLSEPIDQTWDPYTIDELRDLYEYDIMVHDCPHLQDLLDVALRFLSDAINAPGPTKWIAGQERPIREVRERLLKLTPTEIIYSLKKFEDCTSEITNMENYLLTIFYKSKEQMQLDLTNRYARDQAEGWGQPTGSGRQELDR